ncbi:MAG: hypothetical protein K8I29_12715 [Alphaproteobacteria bacterium]|uniref:Lipoprotein n=1 Tax=Candidatus Nitrobium versatile TaxID=2884831 RepID=A0A953JE90_9BACT|nr:hypothetical protein [Candidatus Nitrobium versatile]
MKTTVFKRMAMFFLAGVTGVLLVSCGGGGGTTSSAEATTTTGSDTIVNGIVSKGPVSGATVNGYAIENGGKGRLLGSAMTGQNGAFTMNMGQYNGPMLLEAYGGSYVDEATGVSTDMGTMIFRTAMENVSGNTTMALTPMTEMAVQYMNGNYSDQMMTTANQVMGSAFGVSDIVRTLPKEVGTASTTGQENETYYGLMLAAMSRFSSTTNTDIPALMQGMLDAMTTNDTQALDYYTNMMSQSFTDFTMSPQNMTGMTFSSGMMSTSGITGMMGGYNGTYGGTTGGGGVSGGMMGGSYSGGTTGGTGGGMMGGWLTGGR